MRQIRPIGEGCGMIVRADSRGLGVQSYELWRHIRPDRTLIADMGYLTPYEQRFERYMPDGPEGVTVARVPIDLNIYREWLRGLKTVFSCETFYNQELPDLAREMGVRSILQFNLEFLNYLKDPDWPHPDVFVAPSRWELGRVPFPHVVLPPPVARDKLPFKMREKARKFIHVAGHAAVHDRAGTFALVEALPYVKTPIEFLIRSQNVNVNLPAHSMIGNVEVTVTQGDLKKYEDIYKWADGSDADAFVAPRRYGGLHLPLAEAASLGLPIIALDREPERGLLDAQSLVSAHVLRTFETQAGPIDVMDCDPGDLAAKIDELATTPELVSYLSAASDYYANTISWETLEPEYYALLQGEGPTLKVK